MAQSVNEAILDAAIRHAVLLQQLKKGEARKILAFLERNVLPDLRELFAERLGRIAAAGFDSGTVTTRRYREMIQAINALANEGMRGTYGLVKSRLDLLAVSEARWEAALLRRTVPIALDFTTPAIPTLRAIVTTSPMDGHLISKWFDGHARSTVFKAEQQIGIGITQGEPVDSIVRRLSGVLDQTKSGIEATVRTSINHISTQARELTFEENEDVIKAVQIVAVLDTRTTFECMSQDGKVYPVGEGWRPPGHPNCRTTTTPVLKGWEELGFDLKDLSPGTRASMDGEVPESVTYGEWLKQQSKERQDEALGPGKARIFRTGKLPIEKFVDEHGDPLTIEELEKLLG